MPWTKRAKHYGVSLYIKLERALNDWVLEYCHNGYIITRMMIQIQAIKFTRDKQYEVETGFKASFTMKIVLLHVRFQIKTGSAFLRMLTAVQILRDLKPIP